MILQSCDNLEQERFMLVNLPQPYASSMEEMKQRYNVSWKLMDWACPSKRGLCQSLNSRLLGYLTFPLSFGESVPFIDRVPQMRGYA
jgi:hypothetical protein